MTHAEPFLQAIIEAPDDDAPRLIYADWLEDRGDPRGTFIRVQCMLATLPDDHPSRPELEDEERDLLTSYKADWDAPFARAAKGWEYSRGFVEAITLSDVAFAEHGDRLFRDSPIRRLTMTSLDQQKGAGSALFERVEHCDFGGCRTGAVPWLRTLLASPHNSRLRSLGLSAVALEWPQIQWLTEMPLLQQLEHLDLSHNRGLADRAARALASIPAVNQLTTLNLSGTNLTWAGFKT